MRSTYLEVTRAIENFLLNSKDTKFFKQYQSLMRKIAGANVSLTEFFETMLGVPHRHFTGEFRYKVWAFSTKHSALILYVNNQKGLCIEVPGCCDEDRARAAWQEFRKRALKVLKETNWTRENSQSS